jgi:signal transduction histidine kinase
MRSLFIKIVLWFWPAMILVAGAAMLSLRAYEDREEGLRTLSRDFANPAGNVAAEILEDDGADALRQYLERWARHAGFRGFLFDAHGVEISGQNVPPEAAEAAARAVDTGRGAVNRSAAATFIASQAAGPSGTKYIFVDGRMSRGSGPDEFRSPKGGPPPDLHSGAEKPGGPEPPPKPGEGGPSGAGRDRGPRGGPDGPPFPFGGPLGFLWDQPRSLMLILAAVVLTSGVVCYGLARYLAGPLQRLRASARQLAEGDLTVRVGAAVRNRRDEMGDLGRDFDFMAERIESLVSAQRRLLRDMSHELRSPLARLHVALGLARQRTGPEAGGALDRIELEAQRLNELIGELLELVRLEAAHDVRARTPVDLAALLHEVVADAEFEARGCNREVRLLQCAECMVSGITELLRSAIENVARNAIRYTPEGAAVDISLDCERRADGSWAIIRVRDRGPGVPAESVNDIFRPFYRVGDDRNRQTGGVGLGLAIAQQALRVHGGTIFAVNALGGGLLVELSLPVRPHESGPVSPGTESAPPPP